MSVCIYNSFCTLKEFYGRLAAVIGDKAVSTIVGYFRYDMILVHKATILYLTVPLNLL